MKRLFFLLLLGGWGLQAWAQDSGLATVTPPPGSYEGPVRLHISAPPGASLRYRFLETPSAATFPWTGSLDLDALPGETRSYALRLTTDLASGETMTRDYRYRVTKPAAKIPTVVPEPGRYTSSLAVRPVLPPGWSIQENGTVPQFPRTLDAALGRAAVFVFRLQGPRGEPLEWKYVVDRRDQEALSLELLSPVAGDWANPQTLAAAFRGVDQVRWSYGEHLDTAKAQDYTGPVPLTGTGRQSVTVAARSRSDGAWIEKTVTWTNGASVPEGWPTDIVQNSGLKVPELPGFSISWDEGRSWRPSQAVQEPVSRSSRKLLTLRARKDGAVYRSVYWLDARAPETAQLEFFGGWNPRVVFTGGAELAYQVSWTKADGSVLNEAGPLWGPTGSWKVPDGVVGAKIQYTGANGLTGSSAAGFPETGWSTPVWEPWDQRGPQVDKGALPLGGRILPRPGFQPVYEVSENPDVKEPGPASPLLAGALLPSFPWGSDRTLYARFAWRDAAGLTGPSTQAVAVRVDRVPPAAPEVVSVGGQVLLKASDGEEEGGLLLWAVSPERASDAGSLSFQPYTQPLDAAVLRNGNGKAWFHALMQDRAGNSGPARLNVALVPNDVASAMVQVDPDPAVGETSVEDGGVYPWPAFRLRALDQRSSLWVSVTDLAAVPDDWKTKLQPWDGIFSRGIARGQRRTFLVYWNAKTADGWAWEQPKTLSLTLDLSPPAAPLLARTWPSQPLGSTWTLDLKPGRPGDRLRYSFSLDGTVPPDPAVSGEAWPGSRTWDAPSGSRVTVSVRVAAVSVSGLVVEAGLGGPVTIDRSPPPPAAPALEPFSYRTAPVVVPLPEGATVRYTLTSDGSLPGIPGETSALVPAAGLPLEGKPGQSVLYRFRWRAYSSAGAAGTATDAYGVLVDRSAGSPLVSLGDGTGVPAPLPEGLPANGISRAPVTLRMQSASGLLRFEVREGLGVPRPVTADSEPWSQPLVLDGGEGVDRSYAVSFRAFSPDGVPLSEETTYQVRVDRSLPPAPSVDLLPESRRPEATLQFLPDDPDETLVYRWIWDASPSGKGTGEWTGLTAPAVFSAPGGAITRLKVEAYLRDEAGNQGPVVERSLLIDQNVVYVSPQGTGDGTRSRPLGSLPAALERARREGKSLLLAAAGSYPVPRTLDLGGLQVVGGLSADWEPAGRSLWTAAPGFTGESLIESEDRGWTLSAVDLASSVRLASVVDVKGGSVTVRDSTWTWAGSASGWSQNGGSLDWLNVTVAYAAEPRATLFDWRSLEASVRGLRLAATQNQGGVLVSLFGSKVLVQDLVLVSKQAQDFDGVWSAVKSSLTIDQAVIQAGEGADRATAFVLKDSDATLWNTEVYLYGTLANTGFQTTGGRLEIQKGTLGLLKGTEFNQGLTLDRSEVTLQSLDLKVESGAYQGGLSIDGGSLTLGSSRLRLAGGGQKAWGGQFYSSPLVRLDDVTWTLASKTPGELWKLDRPWAPASTVSGSRATGW